MLHYKQVIHALEIGAEIRLDFTSSDSSGDIKMASQSVAISVLVFFLVVCNEHFVGEYILCETYYNL